MQPIDRDPGPDHIERGLGPGEGGGRVGGVGQLRAEPGRTQGREYRIEGLLLRNRRRLGGLVSPGEVREDAFEDYLRPSGDQPRQLEGLLWRRAEPAHPGVYLQMQANRTA